MFFKLNVCFNTNLLIINHNSKLIRITLVQKLLENIFTIATSPIKYVINDITIFFMKT